MKKIYEKLTALQTSLKAPKTKYNSFGNYKYRSLEDILESVKPHLSELKLTLILSDDVAIVSDRIYVKGVAHLIDYESQEELTVSAFARETDIKKGMDSAQITGAASSYARKYALSGLLLLDDNQDADTEQPQQPTQNPKEEFTKPQNTSKPKPFDAKPKPFDKTKFVKSIKAVIKQRKMPQDLVDTVLGLHGLKSFEDVQTKEEGIALYKAFKEAKVEKVKPKKETKND